MDVIPEMEPPKSPTSATLNINSEELSNPHSQSQPKTSFLKFLRYEENYQEAMPG